MNAKRRRSDAIVERLGATRSRRRPGSAARTTALRRIGHDRIGDTPRPPGSWRLPRATAGSGQPALMAAVVKLGSLPANYQEAVRAVEACAQVDECQAWADKAAAVASYARQAGDESLHRYADRIKARAIRRGGALAEKIEPKHTGRPKNGADDRPNSRKAMAEAAGVSPHQLKQMIRVARVPQADFDRQIESDHPPTVTQLAEQGKSKSLRGNSTVAQFKAATRALATLREFSQFAQATDPIETARGVQPNERHQVKKQVQIIDHWLDRFITAVEGSS